MHVASWRCDVGWRVSCGDVCILACSHLTVVVLVVVLFARGVAWDGGGVIEGGLFLVATCTSSRVVTSLCGAAGYSYCSPWFLAVVVQVVAASRCWQVRHDDASEADDRVVEPAVGGCVVCCYAFCRWFFY